MVGVGFCKLFVNSWDVKWRLIFPGTMIQLHVHFFGMVLEL